MRMMGSCRGRPVAVLCCSIVLLASACTTEPTDVVRTASFGEPIPGITTDELSRFQLGRESFRHQFTAEEGLGPRFNENACNACHTDPADGGTGETSVTKATRLNADGSCDPLAEQGGANLRIQTTSGGSGQRVQPPAEATHVARFTIPFVFGLGFVDAIPQAALASLADPDDRDGDGISGRLGRDDQGRFARFGRKADMATLADFVEGASRLEMGLTNPGHPDESAAGAIPPLTDGSTDPAADPEVDDATLLRMTDFVRLLAPPARGAVTASADSADVARGEALFTGLGCAGCHVPVLTAGTSPVAAIDGADIALFSDLLLHDMGPNLEGTCTANASTTEWRTEPLMGLRARRIFLHDGRVGRVIDAILAHGGEAEAARHAFEALDRITQESLIRYLDTL